MKQELLSLGKQPTYKTVGLLEFFLGGPKDFIVPEWKKKKLWTTSHKVDFISGILSGLPIGQITFHTVGREKFFHQSVRNGKSYNDIGPDHPLLNNSKLYMDVLVDGYNRLSCIEDVFITGEFPLYLWDGDYRAGEGVYLSTKHMDGSIPLSSIFSSILVYKLEKTLSGDSLSALKNIVHCMKELSFVVCKIASIYREPVDHFTDINQYVEDCRFDVLAVENT